jgi:hypothetical protein
MPRQQITLDSSIKAWQRQPGESGKVYDYLRDYLAQCPSRRSLSLVAEHHGKSERIMQRHSAQYRWVERAAAWEDEQAAVAYQVRLDEIDRVNREDVAFADAMFGELRDQLEKVGRKLGTSPHAYAEWAKVATRIRRDALNIAEQGPATITSDSAHALNVQHQLEVRNTMRNLPPELVLKLGDLVIEVERWRAQAPLQQRGLMSTGS